MAEYTLTYSDGFKGFPSFYSFIPDYMIGMNNYFYTFKGGDLYRHNVNERRNNFYSVDYSSKITSVFNDGPLDNKLFKTINLESSFAGASHAWGGTFDTDIQTTGFIDALWFEKKEGAWFAFMRNEPGSTALVSGTNTGVGANKLEDTNVDFSTLLVTAGDIVLNPSTGKSALVTSVAATILDLDTDIFPSSPQSYSVFDGSPPSELELRSLSGIGACTTVVFSGVVGTPTTINFALTTSIGSALSIGDQLYAKTTPRLIGTVTAITVDLPNGVNSITVASTIAGSTAASTDLILYIKNQMAESSGVLGHYCQFELTNTSTEAVELFAVETEIMKSFP
tara:strand:+ start:783 stop:1796 length:1014 start_codon:yes stop_codon:yes gene_type:complete